MLTKKINKVEFLSRALYGARLFIYDLVIIIARAGGFMVSFS